TLDAFRSQYHTLLEAYFAENFALDPELDLECLRIPHFYHAFYVYKYATGISASVALSQRVLAHVSGSMEAYLNFLLSGCSKFGELGSAASILQNGKPLIELYSGFCDARHEKPWEANTLVLVWSATKGIGSACVLHVLQEHRIGIDRGVAEFWPEFAQAGKEKITLSQLLSHQAGLCALDARVDILDYGAVITALEVQKPLWLPGTAHGYHARTFGFLLDELVRRIAGKTLSQYWREAFAQPLNLDLWIGLPERENSRVATIYAAKSGRPPEPKNRQSGSDFYSDLTTPGTLAR